MGKCRVKHVEARAGKVDSELRRGMHRVDSEMHRGIRNGSRQ